MTYQTIVAVYDTPAHADAAVRDLEAANVPAGAISQHRGEAGSTTSAPAREQGFWASLFGGEPDHDTSVYDRSIESGSSVVTVRVLDEDFDRVGAILETHHPIDLDERAAHYDATETTTTRSVATPRMDTTSRPAETGSDTMQLAEETLAVGKRAVSGGTTRIRRYVVETPVEEQVALRSERVTLERRPVTDGRSLGDANFSDKVVEMTETSEEAVVSKTAHVTEEVSLRKDVTEHVETVRDTVRRDEVEIEKIPGDERRTADRSSIAPTPGHAPNV
jgi:uncharacterized protein (TIGR02271 family)